MVNYKLQHRLDFLKKIIEDKNYALLENFEEEFFTPEVINEYGTKLVSILKKQIPKPLKRNQYFFNTVILSGRYDLLLEFTNNLLSPELIDKYGLEIVKNISTIPNDHRSNTDLLLKIFEAKRYDLVFIFYRITFNDERILKYKEAIIDLLPIYNPNDYFVYTSIPFFVNSKELLLEALNKKRFDLICFFKSTLYSKDIVDKYSTEILSNINSYCKLSYYTTNPYILELYLKNKRYSDVKTFKSEAFTEYIVENYYEDILISYNYILPEYLLENSNLLKHSLKNKDHKLTKTFYAEAYKKDVIDAYGQDIINIIGTEKIPYYLIENKDFFVYCLKNNQDKLITLFTSSVLSESIIEAYGEKILNILVNHPKHSFYYVETLLNYAIKNNYQNHITRFSQSAYTKRLVDKHQETLLPIIEKYIDSNYKENSNLLELSLKYNRKDLVFKFSKEAFTQSILEQYGDKIISYINTEDRIPSNLKSFETIRDYLISISRYDLAIQFIAPKYILKDSKLMESFANELNLSSIELCDKIRRLYKNNDELFNTLYFEILDEKYNSIDKKYLEIFVLYKDIQELLFKLDNYEIQILSKLLPILDTTNYDNTLPIYNILNNLSNYKELTYSLNLLNITNEELKNLILILQNPNNTYNITNQDQLSNNYFNIIKEKYFTNISKLILKESFNIEELKVLIFQKLYNINLDEAKFIIDRYCHNIKLLIDSKTIPNNIKTLLIEIYNIYNLDDKDLLKNIYLDNNPKVSEFNELLSLEAVIRKSYAKSYSDSLYKLKEEHKLTDQHELASTNPAIHKKITSIKYNNRKPQFYIMDGDFNIQMHSLGAYRYWKRPINFKVDWERPKLAYHGICTSYIRNDQLSNSKLIHPNYGFSTYEDSAFLTMGNYDLESDNPIKAYQTSSIFPYTFFPSEYLIDYTRNNHNELVLERRTNNKESNYKRVPDYIIYYVDDINNLNNFELSNQLFEETLQASIDQNIPIIIIDRLKYAKYELEKCNKLKQQFIKTKDTTYLEQLLLKYFNNIVSHRHFEDDQITENNKVFNEYTFNSLYEELLDYINTLDEENYYRILSFLKEQLIIEDKKRNPAYQDYIFNLKHKIVAIDNVLNTQNKKILLNYN